MKERKRFGKIPINKIDFGKRHRKDYNNIEELAADIKKMGLINPITLADKKQLEDGKLGDLDDIETDDDKRYLLLAGGRRITAWKQHLIDEEDFGYEIPSYIFPRLLTYYEIRELELMENISRENLNWQEKSTLTKELHDLEQEKKGKKVKSSEGGHGLKETAEMVGSSKSTVKNEVDLGRALEEMPELGEIKNKTEALKVMKEIKKNDQAERKAKRVRKEREEKGMDGMKEEVMDAFVEGDFFERAKKLNANSFDLIEIDPPYAIDLANKKKKAKHKTLTYNEVPADEYEHFMTKTFHHAKRLIKPDGWLVCWYGISPWHDMMVELMRDAGFKTNGIPMLWVKDSGQTMRPHHYFASCYEPALYARASEDSRLNKSGSANYMIHKKVPHSKKWHPTQRPVSLMKEVIERFIPDGKILVPFAGSGVTLRTAYNMGMKAVGFDLDEDAKNKHDAYVGDQEDIDFEL